MFFFNTSKDDKVSLDQFIRGMTLLYGDMNLLLSFSKEIRTPGALGEEPLGIPELSTLSPGCSPSVSPRCGSKPQSPMSRRDQGSLLTLDPCKRNEL